MDFPGSVVKPTHLHTYSFESGMIPARFPSGATSGSFAWPSANLASYIPMTLPYPYPVQRVFWVNGATGGYNVDFGIYTPGGTRIYSTGSTAQSGTSVIQYVTPSTTFVLAPGRYFFAISCSGTTGAFNGQSFSSYPASARLQGLLQEASALPLPATATFAGAADACVAFCGVTRTTTGY